MFYTAEQCRIRVDYGAVMIIVEGQERERRGRNEALRMHTAEPTIAFHVRGAVNAGSTLRDCADNPTSSLVLVQSVRPSRRVK